MLSSLSFSGLLTMFMPHEMNYAFPKSVQTIFAIVFVVIFIVNTNWKPCFEIVFKLLPRSCLGCSRRNALMKSLKSNSSVIEIEFKFSGQFFHCISSGLSWKTLLYQKNKNIEFSFQLELVVRPLKSYFHKWIVFVWNVFVRKNISLKSYFLEQTCSRNILRFEIYQLANENVGNLGFKFFLQRNNFVRVNIYIFFSIKQKFNVLCFHKK